MATEDNPRVFLPPPLIFGGLLALGLLIQSDPARLEFATLLGALLASAGLLLIGLALGLFRRSGTRPEPWQPASALVSNGIYGCSRNPMYLGMAVLCVGLAIVFSSLPGVVLSVVAVAIVDRFVVPREEGYLKRRFGEDYRTYCSHVRRWL